MKQFYWLIIGLNTAGIILNAIARQQFMCYINLMGLTVGLVGLRITKESNEEVK